MPRVEFKPRETLFSVNIQSPVTSEVKYKAPMFGKALETEL